jgi:AcrR family transcriptional regulator
MPDKAAANVQKLPTMKTRKTKTPANKTAPKTDRRVLKTRNALGDALVALLQEKHFQQITVQDVLDRARVGRSTFYVHYRDKNDLFLSDVEDFFELCSGLLSRHNASPKRLLPVQEIFTHIREMREFYTAVVRSGKINDVEVLGRGYFARSIEERFQRAGLKMDSMQRSAKAHALAGSFFSLLNWWVDKGMKADPKEMDTLFHQMAWKGLVSV